MRSRRIFIPMYLLGCCALLTLLWLPGTRYPIVSDTINYALLGRSLWEHGTYALFGVPHAKYLFLYSFVSYLFTALLGLQWGMHILSLVSGFAALTVTFLLIRRTFSPIVAAGTVLAAALHPTFILLSTVGSSDLFFAFLFFASAYAYLLAGERRGYYLLSGILLGLACLTRYNGLPLFVVFVAYTLWKRRADLRDPWFIAGMLGGAGIFALWLVRNTLVFGNPFFSEYTVELTANAPHHLRQILSNLVYYGNPVHNVFPFFFPFALYGLWRHAREQNFLLLIALAGFALAAIWWVQAIRFALPSFIVLLAFAVWGILDLLSHFPRSSFLLAVSLSGAFLVVQGLSLCLYTYGACNAAFDRTFGLVPRNMGLSSEGFFAWDEARNFLNANAPAGANVLVFDEFDAVAWREGVFRPDLRVTTDRSLCPLFSISQRNDEGSVLYQTPDAPVTYVMEKECAGE
ncbi:glycosyltransferase family 39 protein [Candidatus Peregrinibacteria bacterium]|nr:glycosyltransferase family 39 protein [Candidatus Peregrinibacteria bacterium]